MSKIDPVHRSGLPPVDPTAGLNDSLPAQDIAHPDVINAVKSSHKSDLSGDRRELVMSVDPESGRLVTKVIERDSEDVVFQQPPDRILDLAREIRRRHRGLPVSDEAPRRRPA
jgi:uncharacterized FlaG/YvyC family protein